MPMKQQGRKIYRSMQGKQVDMDLLRKRNELTPAVGNARVNARGDELGPGGKIIRKKEDIVKEYYQSENAAIDQIPNRKKAEPVQERITKKSTKKVEEKVEEPVTKEEWVEDEDGNFVQKGE